MRARRVMIGTRVRIPLVSRLEGIVVSSTRRYSENNKKIKRKEKKTTAAAARDGVRSGAEVRSAFCSVAGRSPVLINHTVSIDTRKGI